jgi:two-component system sensor histidine kinase BarA
MSTPSSSPAGLFDPQAALARAKGDRDFLDQVLDMFLAEAPDRLSGLASALKTRDLERIGKQAHSLKAVAGIIGAPQVSREAARVQETAMSGDADASLDLGSRLMRDYRHLVDEVRAHKKT